MSSRSGIDDASGQHAIASHEWYSFRWISLKNALIIQYSNSFLDLSRII